MESFWSWHSPPFGPQVLRDIVGVLAAYCKAGTVPEARTLHEGLTALCLPQAARAVPSLVPRATGFRA